MGTRGSVGFIYNDKEYLSYNQFDSYPEGLGHDVLKFISNINLENGWDKFKENAQYLKNVTGKITDNNLIEKYKKYSDLSVSNQSYSDPYCLFRKIQGSSWLTELYEGSLQDYNLNNNFIKDSLYCEYAYIINLDTMMFEYYDGFQKKPQKNSRFGTVPYENYYPCRLVFLYNLEYIKNDKINFLVKKMNNISNSGEDDPSVLNFSRKYKLESINKKREL